MIKSTILLIFAAIVWGGGFIATKWTLVDFDPYWSNSLRFIVAAVFIAPFLGYQALKKEKSTETIKGHIQKNFKKRDLQFYLWPLLCAVILYFSMQAQTIGLKYTTTAKSGFITALYAFFVPILLMLFVGARYQKTYWALLASSLFGIALLCDLDFNSFNQGDAWTLLCSLLFALHILITARVTNRYHPVELNGYQCLFVALISIPFALGMEGIPNIESLFTGSLLEFPSPLWGFLFLGILSSNLAFSIQAYAQKTIAPHIIGLILLLESVFAAILGYLLLDEKLSMMAISGCTLLLISLLLVPKFGRLKKSYLLRP